MPVRGKPRATQTQWGIKGERLLADGEWHDGMTIVRDIEKLITPGVAMRKVEAQRESLYHRRGTKDSGRKRAIRDSTLIAMGKRRLVQQMLLGRVRLGTWETDPSPIPQGGWSVGGWRVRSRRARQTTLQRIAKDRYHLAPATLRRLALSDPALPHEVVGRVMYIQSSDLPRLDERVRTYRKESRDRYGAARRSVAQRLRDQEPTRYAVTVLGRQFGVGQESATKIVKAYPDFPWDRRGRNTYVPVQLIAEFGVLCQKWQAERPARISASGRRTRAKKREEQERGGATPEFADVALTDLYARYRDGEGELQSQVYDEMRRAFHAAPEV